MFKKVEIWVLYLIILLCAIFTIIFGALVRDALIQGSTLKKYNLLWVSETALFLAEIPKHTKDLFFGSALSVPDRFPSLDGFSGTPNSKESYLLHSRYDDDKQESVIELVNLTNFKIEHTWNPDIDLFNNDIKKEGVFKYLNRDQNNARARLHHPQLTKDGGLLFRIDVLRKIDQCSNLIFQNKNHRVHHSIELDNHENIWIPTRIYPSKLPISKVGDKFIDDGGYLDDAIAKFSPEGEIIFEKSVSEILIDNGLEYLLFSVGDNKFTRDPIHLNNIQPVNFDGKHWKKGDVFLSLRHQSMIILYRPSNNKIIWKSTGPYFYQHDVDILDENRISIFNNNTKVFNKETVVDGNNEVVVYDFTTNKYSPYLKDSLAKNEVMTITEGRSEILTNGDLFIEESNYGRILYFNADGTLRWTHLNRSDKGGTYQVSWSRILHSQEDIKIVQKFITNKKECDV